MTRTLVVLPVILAACQADPGTRGSAGALPDGDGDATGGAALDVQPIELDQVFAEAGEEFDVPVELLKSVAWTETRWHMVRGVDDLDEPGPPPAFGVMGLRGDHLADGAASAGVTERAAQTEPRANIRAAAAWMSDHADQMALDDRTDLGAWAEVIAEYSFIDDELARSSYVHEEVYHSVRAGFEVFTVDGDPQGALEPIEVWPSFTIPPPTLALAAGPDYEAGVWRPSPNNSARPNSSSGQVAMVIIHTCEGSYTGCWSWLSQSQSGVSAHYVVNSDGSQVSQLVRENRKAWHISAKYNCSRNENHNCALNNVSSNNFTVGIEHAGFSSQAAWDPGLIDASARLVCDITRDNGLTIDDVHIVGHGRLQPWNRTDPGSNWPWTDYIDRIAAHCGNNPPPDPMPDPTPDPMPGPGPGPDTGPDTIVVDSNNNNNDAAKAMISVSNNWVSANSTPGHFGTGYWYASAQAVSDPATFFFFAPAAGPRTIDVWYTAGGNRASAAPFIIRGASGQQIDVEFVDQTRDGGAWKEIGTWDFDPGWNSVQLSRWTSSGTVIADAIRVR